MLSARAYPACLRQASPIGSTVRNCYYSSIAVLLWAPFFAVMAHSYVALVAARIITGLFGGVIGSISMAIITDIFGFQQRGRVMGFIQMGFGASQVLGIPVGLYLANLLSWEAPFWMVAGLSMAIAIAIALYLKPITAHLAYSATNRH
jgi:predicted MFS family arabinose efflux permease